MKRIRLFSLEMTTIIRVKRHRSEDPVEALILSCKRKKTENSDSNLFQKVLNFSGTVKEKDDNVATSTVEFFHRESKHTTFKKNHTPEIRAKQRQEKRERREDNRFLLLSCLRSGSGANNSNVNPRAHPEENITIVDVSKETSEELKEHDGSDVSYVYDLYSVQDNDSYFNDLYMENLLSVQPLSSELEYWKEDDEEIDPDEDDSNEENNWRNDYPDTDSSMDENEDDDILVRQLKKCHLGNSSVELSCDSGEEEYLNYDDDQKYHYYEAENIGGKRYAKYKANALRQIIHDKESDDTSESEEDYRDCEEYCRDSD